MAYVKRDPADAWMEDGGFEKMLRKFKRLVDADGTLKTLRRHEYYMSPSMRRKEKSKEAERRRRIAEAKKTKYYSNGD